MVITELIVWVCIWVCMEEMRENRLNQVNEPNGTEDAHARIIYRALVNRWPTILRSHERLH